MYYWSVTWLAHPLTGPRDPKPKPAPVNDPDCFPISLPCSENHFTDDDNEVCNERKGLEFARSLAFCEDPNTPREQMNGITAYVDASNVYGSSIEVTKLLRESSGGKLKLDGNGLLPEINGSARMAGDVRALEMPGLASMHTIFAREHNRIAAVTIMLLKPHFHDNYIVFLPYSWTGACR